MESTSPTNETSMMGYSDPPFEPSGPDSEPTIRREYRTRGVATPASMADMSDGEIDALQASEQADASAPPTTRCTPCVRCLGSTANHQWTGCGHTVACNRCAPRLPASAGCPMCGAAARTPLTTSV